MKSIKLSLLAAAMVISGCASTPGGTFDSKTVSTATGAVIGCVTGGILAKITGNNAAAGCIGGGLVGGLIGFEKARQEEIAAAAEAQQQAVAALARRPDGAAAKVGEVKTVEVTATDKRTRETRKYQAFESATVELPLSAKGTPEYDAAIDKLKTLAERVADERGSARIEVAMSPNDARARKVALESVTVKSAKGHPITVAKTADNAVLKGIERITVRAGALQHTEV